MNPLSLHCPLPDDLLLGTSQHPGPAETNGFAKVRVRQEYQTLLNSTAEKKKSLVDQKNMDPTLAFKCLF